MEEGGGQEHQAQLQVPSVMMVMMIRRKTMDDGEEEDDGMIDERRWSGRRPTVF